MHHLCESITEINVSFSPVAHLIFIACSALCKTCIIIGNIGILKFVSWSCPNLRHIVKSFPWMFYKRAIEHVLNDAEGFHEFILQIMTSHEC